MWPCWSVEHLEKVRTAYLPDRERKADRAKIVMDGTVRIARVEQGAVTS